MEDRFGDAEFALSKQRFEGAGSAGAVDFQYRGGAGSVVFGKKWTQLGQLRRAKTKKRLRKREYIVNYL